MLCSVVLCSALLRCYFESLRDGHPTRRAHFLLVHFLFFLLLFHLLLLFAVGVRFTALGLFFLWMMNTCPTHTHKVGSVALGFWVSKYFYSREGGGGNLYFFLACVCSHKSIKQEKRPPPWPPPPTKFSSVQFSPFRYFIYVRRILASRDLRNDCSSFFFHSFFIVLLYWGETWERESTWSEVRRKEPFFILRFSFFFFFFLCVVLRFVFIVSIF